MIVQIPVCVDPSTHPAALRFLLVWLLLSVRKRWLLVALTEKGDNFRTVSSACLWMQHLCLNFFKTRSGLMSMARKGRLAGHPNE